MRHSVGSVKKTSSKEKPVSCSDRRAFTDFHQGGGEKSAGCWFFSPFSLTFLEFSPRQTEILDSLVPNMQSCDLQPSWFHLFTGAAAIIIMHFSLSFCSQTKELQLRPCSKDKKERGPSPCLTCCEYLEQHQVKNTEQEKSSAYAVILHQNRQAEQTPRRRK